jgi:4-diphosphocytidyl-2-C-methyl-D-erythritol kinase
VAASPTEFAFAKINLTLRVIGRRPDGYHELDSLVAFASLADQLSLVPGPALALTVRGRTADATGPDTDNLVLRAAHALIERCGRLQVGHFTLHKNLPVAAGLGGGSADAAAALRLLARINGLAPDDRRLMEAARAVGADVPVCLDPRPRRMRGIGETLSDPLDLPRLPALLVNPGVSVSTRDVFAALRAPSLTATASSEADAPADDVPRDRPSLLAYLAEHGNDLESPATALAPIIAETLAALRALPGCRLARMSGSGATCFALFDTAKAATIARNTLRRAKSEWWMQTTVLGSP